MAGLTRVRIGGCLLSPWFDRPRETKDKPAAQRDAERAQEVWKEDADLDTLDPVIIVTGRGAEAERVLGLSAGADDVDLSATQSRLLKMFAGEARARLLARAIARRRVGGGLRRSTSARSTCISDACARRCRGGENLIPYTLFMGSAMASTKRSKSADGAAESAPGAYPARGFEGRPVLASLSRW
jgi:hypothetical protein